MKLADYFVAQGIRPAEFARSVNSSRQNVSRWMLGQSVPRPAEMRRIQEATGGQVTPNDFFTPQPSLVESL